MEAVCVLTHTISSVFISRHLAARVARRARKWTRMRASRRHIARSGRATSMTTQRGGGCTISARTAAHTGCGLLQTVNPAAPICTGESMLVPDPERLARLFARIKDLTRQNRITIAKTRERRRGAITWQSAGLTASATWVHTLGPDALPTMRAANA